jgi:diacylglycerol kinase (ATP)
MTNSLKGRTGFARIIRATGYSFEGLRAAYSGESAFRQETWLALVMIPAALWLGQSWVEVALLAGSVLLVMIVELLNSGIEAITDRVSLENHELAKRAKDMGSAAVMLSLLNVPAVWLLVLFG